MGEHEFKVYGKGRSYTIKNIDGNLTCGEYNVSQVDENSYYIKKPNDTILVYKES